MVLMLTLMLQKGSEYSYGGQELKAQKRIRSICRDVTSTRVLEQDVSSDQVDSI